MTWTDDFAVSGWVKLSSYTATDMNIASRYNGTSGWQLYINSSAQVTIIGRNAGAGNFSGATSYQSVPLNKWVHIAGQLDMSTFTATTTTSYIMLDGIDVATSVVRAGTNPTALVQAGNLEIGSTNGGTTPFPGKIAQVAIYSAKVTQATIRASMNQTLTGSETSLAAGYTFNNSINDLSANANNLTANGGAVATALDTPFTQTVTGVSTGTTNFGIVTAISFSTDTTLTIQVPEGGTLPTTGGLSAAYYSLVKVPFGFPAQRGKWTVGWYCYSNNLALLGTSGAWGTGATTATTGFTIPVGEWQVTYSYSHYVDRGGSVHLETYSSLSTNASAVSDGYWTVNTKSGVDTGLSYSSSIQTRSGPLSLATATIYYGLFKATSSDGTISNHLLNGIESSSFVTAECAYL
jgi:hypothetical protein